MRAKDLFPYPFEKPPLPPDAMLSVIVSDNAEHLLSGRVGTVRVTAKNNRHFLESLPYALLTGKAYAAKVRILDHLEQRQVKAVIPTKFNQKQHWEFDRNRYR